MSTGVGGLGSLGEYLKCRRLYDWSGNSQAMPS